VGFNGRLLPVELEDDSEPDTGLRAFLLLDGALQLRLDRTYDLRLRARYDTPARAYTQDVDTAGTWRFLAWRWTTRPERSQ
jgi:hypothetical protein